MSGFNRVADSLTCIDDATLEASELEEVRAWIGIHGFPPVKILKCTVVFKELWGCDRLLPYDFDLEDPFGLPIYETYLDKFYNLKGIF